MAARLPRLFGGTRRALCASDEHAQDGHLVAAHVPGLTGGTHGALCAPKIRAYLLLGLLPIFVTLIVYAVTWSFIWDEGFHILAAQLIAGGKRPYLDFCFPQTPLNAYINAAVLLVFGDHWKPVHVVAALYMCATVWLVADFVQTRLPFARWRTPCALAAAVLYGLDVVIVQFGPAAQAYAIGELCVTAAFRAALPAVSSKRIWFALLSGLCAGVAAGSTLLTAPVAMVLLLWLLFSRCGVSKVAAYLLGCAVPFAPVAWLYWQGPKQTLFNVLQYQTLYRNVNWGDTNLHDVDSLTSWITSPGALMLIAFFAAAIVFLIRDKNSERPLVRRELWLAVALTVALVLFISTAHPTFDRYYTVAIPFAGMLSGLGVYAVGSRLGTPRHAWWACGIVIALGCGILARATFDERDDEHWSDYEEISKQVAEVTPIGANLYADELVYFILQRTPPDGMAFSYAEKLDLPPAQEKLFHIISSKQLKQQMQSGHFATLETCKQVVLDDFEPEKYFKNHSEPSDCDVFSTPKPGPGSNVKR